MAKQLISESTVKKAIAAGERTITITKGDIITPLAASLASTHGITIVTQPPSTESHMSKEAAMPRSTETNAEGKVVAFGSDHGGFQLKQQLKAFVESLGYTTLDVGTHDEKPCDYPDFAYAVAHAVSSGKAWRGVMIDGAGIGSCVVANKVPGIKAACCHNEFVARNAREHNDTNVLTLGSRVTGSEVCKEILRVWLETWFAGGRHKTRVDKIDEVERRFIR